MKKKIVGVLLMGLAVIGLTGCGSSNSGAEKSVKEFVKCAYGVDLQCVVSSIDYSGSIAYKQSGSKLDDFWDKYEELEKKNTNNIVLENAKKNYDLAKNFYNQYDIKNIKTETENISKDIYKVKTTVSLKDKDRTWDNVTNYIVIKKDGKFSVIEATADDRPVYIISNTVDKMTKDLKYDDGTLVNY